MIQVKHKFKMVNGLTRKELANKVGCPYYIVDYLRNLNRLPVLKPTKGRGDSTIFSPEAIEVLKRHIEY